MIRNEYAVKDKGNMKDLSLCVGGILLLVAALATPLSVIYGIYDWAVIDLQFKVALWAACKSWISMAAMVVPGFILINIGSQ